MKRRMLIAVMLAGTTTLSGVSTGCSTEPCAGAGQGCGWGLPDCCEELVCTRVMGGDRSICTYVGAGSSPDPSVAAKRLLSDF